MIRTPNCRRRNYRRRGPEESIKTISFEKEMQKNIKDLENTFDALNTKIVNGLKIPSDCFDTSRQSEQYKRIEEIRSSARGVK